MIKLSMKYLNMDPDDEEEYTDFQYGDVFEY
jgi:hypothetical protein